MFIVCTTTSTHNSCSTETKLTINWETCCSYLNVSFVSIDKNLYNTFYLMYQNYANKFGFCSAGHILEVPSSLPTFLIEPNHTSLCLTLHILARAVHAMHQVTTCAVLMC